MNHDPNATFTDLDGGEELQPGGVLNEEYELVHQVGRGGMGVVWKAVDLTEA